MYMSSEGEHNHAHVKMKLIQFCTNILIFCFNFKIYLYNRQLFKASNMDI